MKGAGRIVVFVVVLWAAACFQAIAPRLAVFGAAPDFLLVALVALSLHTSRKAGAALGFIAGFVQGALASASIGYYIVSRTLAGFFTAWSKDIRFEHSWWLVFLTAFFATVLSQAIQLFLPPALSISPFAASTILIATYNGVLAMPLYALLNRLLAPVHV